MAFPTPLSKLCERTEHQIGHILNTNPPFPLRGSTSLSTASTDRQNRLLQNSRLAKPRRCQPCPRECPHPLCLPQRSSIGLEEKRKIPHVFPWGAGYD